ncbi:Hypothetical predicted protein [Pelobates cultripes]|uniref:Uncharacterized protein n=1 Tax=Pelobates cultripes TaxID=61616 RepID=A0AAD1T9F9_PELCU|nr:Hypothetical predicted protein [Pelobates cultripes]
MMFRGLDEKKNLPMLAVKGEHNQTGNTWYAAASILRKRLQQGRWSSVQMMMQVMITWKRNVYAFRLLAEALSRLQILPTYEAYIPKWEA